MRLRPLRLLSFIPLFYLTATGLWIFLPSPTINRILRSNHIQSTLTSGRPLVTVHKDTPTFRYGTHRSNGETTHVAITYQLQSSRSTDKLTLLIDDAKIDLTEHASETPPYLSPSPLTSHIRTGATNHIVNLPWFHLPDAILFHHHMHGFPANLKFVLLTPEKGVVEVWTYSKLWDQFSPDGTIARPAETKLLEGAGIEKEREAGMLLRLRNVLVDQPGRERRQMGGIVVEDVKGQLVSRTFRVRMWLLGPLAPMLSVVFMVACAVVLPFLGIVALPVAAGTGLYLGVVGVWWIRVGKLKFTEWCQERLLLWPLRCLFGCFGVARRVKKVNRRRVLWTMSGPMEESDEESNYLRNGAHPRTFRKRLDAMFEGARTRTTSVDLEARELDDGADEKVG